MKNLLYQGNCIELLKKIDSEMIDLVYLDPPFFSNREFHAYNKKNERITFEDLWKNDINYYLDFINEILNQLFRILKKTGMIFLHCDYHASHYLKVELDKTFGIKNFRNEIIWKRHNSQNNAKQGAKIFGRIHDTIFVYSKTNNYKWNQIYEDYSQEYIDKVYNKIDGVGEQYALGDLSGPGGASKGNPYFEFMGFQRYWRYNKEKMIRLQKEGKIVQTKPDTLPKLKRYLKEMKGVPCSDIWLDIPNEQTSNRKSILYPTQKPLKLLDRIIKSASDEGDLVLDPCCGSGTTLISAELNGRKWLGFDKNPTAIKIALERLQKIKASAFQIEYKPVTITA